MGQFHLQSGVRSLTSFDVSSLPPRDRFPFWNEVICTQFSPAENSSHVRGEQYRATLEHRDLGQIALSKLTCVPFLSLRDQKLLRSKPNEDFFLSFLTEGKARFSQSGRHTEQYAGQLLLYDSARPFTYELLSDYSAVVLKLPRRVVLSRFSNPEAMTARSVSCSQGIGALAGRMIAEAADLDLRQESATSNRVASALVEVLAAAFESSCGTAIAVHARDKNLLDRAKEYMLAQMDDPDLDCDHLIDVLGVSRRTLNRRFAEEQTTPSRWLWQKRLERSKEMLESGKQTRITDVALTCGFSDFSHFSRAFKKEFGITPKSARDHDTNHDEPQCS